MRRFFIVLGCTLAGAVALTVSTTAASASSPAPLAVPGWAGYFTFALANSASTDVVVPAINCRGNAPGNFVGSGEGVQILNDDNDLTSTLPFLNAVSMVRTYCEGPTAYYDTAFYLPTPTASPDEYSYVPTGVPVRPGDIVNVSLQVTASQSRASVVNLTSGRGWSAFGSAIGGGMTDASPDIGVVALDGNNPNEIGTGGTLTNPAPSTPALFVASEVGGSPLSAEPGLTAQEWTNPSNASEVFASPTPLLFDGFAVTFNNHP